ncbi:MAG: tetratricopeptide repeat protein [Planctomycetaceae bacterium]
MSHSPTAVNQGPPDPRYGDGWSRMTDLIETGGSWSGRERNCCYLNIGGDRAFADVSYASGLDFPDDARAVAVVDWDHDGDLDLWITNRTAPRLRFLRNNGSTGQHGLAVRLQATRGNRDAIGARLVLSTVGETSPALTRSLQAGSGYLAQSSKWVHFGVGASRRSCRLVVHWPGGATETIDGLEPGGRYLVVEGSGEATGQAERQVALPDGGLSAVPSTGKARIPLLERLPLPRLEFLDDENRLQVVRRSGRPVLLNLWATWCLPCVAELHGFTERKAEIDRAGLDILALSVDGLVDGEPAEAGLIRSFLEKHEIGFGSGRATSAAIDRLDVVHDVVLTVRTRLDDKYTLPVPASFLLDASGRLAVIYKGPVSVDTLLADVALITAAGGGKGAASGRISGRAEDLAVAYPGRWFLRPHGLAGVAIRLADRLVRRGHLDDAQAFALLAADLGERNGNPFNLKHRAAGVLVDLGNAWDGRENLNRAEKAYVLARRVDPLDAKATTNLGNVQLRRGDVRAAEKTYQETLLLDPDQLQAHMNLGSICLREQRNLEAVKYFREAVRINPRFAPAHNLLGTVLLKQGRRQSARRHFQLAVELDPKYEDARANLRAVGGPVAAGAGS